MAASPLGHLIGWCLCCRFVIGREKPGEQSEVAQLIQQTLEQERWQREMMEQRYNPYMEEDEEVKLHKIHNGPLHEQLNICRSLKRLGSPHKLNLCICSEFGSI